MTKPNNGRYDGDYKIILLTIAREGQAVYKRLNIDSIQHGVIPLHHDNSPLHHSNAQLHHNDTPLHHNDSSNAQGTPLCYSIIIHDVIMCYYR